MMASTMLVFWGVVAWVIVTLVRQTGDRRPTRADPEEILAERFARGEIDDEEFARRRAALRSSR